jgi:hypothetical protein
MMHVICYSGGHSSALVAIEVVRKYGKADVVLLNHDIHPSVEDPDIKRFKAEVAAHLGLPVTYANHAKVAEWDQFDVVMHAKAFKVGNGSELCTSRLKTEPFKKWIDANAPKESTTIYYGFDADEGVRIQRRIGVLGIMGYRSEYPLAHWPRTILSTSEVGIAPPLTYAAFRHANCIGCLKAGKQHWFIVFCTRPDLWAKGKAAEEAIGYSIHADETLEELEPLFRRMQAAGILATEHIDQQRFWPEVARALRQPGLFDGYTAKPCECVV